MSTWSRVRPVAAQVLRRKRSWKLDVDRDATIVDAGMRGLHARLGLALGISPDELYRHSQWLKRQNETYLDQVTARVIQLQDARMTVPNAN